MCVCVWRDGGQGGEAGRGVEGGQGGSRAAAFGTDTCRATSPMVGSSSRLLAPSESLTHVHEHTHALSCVLVPALHQHTNCIARPHGTLLNIIPGPHTKHSDSTLLPVTHQNPTPPHLHGCRYPAGESYLDVIQRLEPVIIEMEREKECIVVVGHQAVLRAVLGYFMAKPLAVRGRGRREGWRGEAGGGSGRGRGGGIVNTSPN